MSLIIDTDIGSDIDDALALAYALKSDLDLKLITTVHGPTSVRADIANKICRMLGKDIPVAIGESQPLKQKTIFVTGLEETFLGAGEHYLALEKRVEVLSQEIRNNRYEIEIAALGPLTNLAKAFQADPRLPSYLRRIYVMGNAILTPTTYYLNYRAHNLKVDPEAADIVFSSGVEIYLITTDICKKNFLTEEDLASLKDPLFEYLRLRAEKWLGFIGHEKIYLYDPLVIHHYFDPCLTNRVKYGNLEITAQVDAEFKNRFLEALTK